MGHGNGKDLFQSVMDLWANDNVREALNPVKCLTDAAHTRTQADRIRAGAKQLAVDDGETGSVMSVLAGIGGIFGPMESAYRVISGMLAGLGNKELAAVYTLTMPSDQRHANAHLWRSRVLADMIAASTYYKVTAELISLAMKTLDKCAPSMEGGEIALLLNHAAALLVDAAKFMGTAGAELGDNSISWQNLEDAVKQLRIAD